MSQEKRPIRDEILKFVIPLIIVALLGKIVLSLLAFKIKGITFDSFSIYDEQFKLPISELVDCKLPIILSFSIQTNGKSGQIDYTIVVDGVEGIKKTKIIKKGETNIFFKEELIFEEDFSSDGTFNIRYTSRQRDNFLFDLCKEWLGSPFTFTGESNSYDYRCAASIPDLVFIQGGRLQQNNNYVNISSFYIQQKEVTYDDWRRYREDCGNLRPTYYYPYTLRTPSSLKMDCPIVWVSRDEAECYCNNLGMRLPTKVEWEYSAQEGIHKSKLNNEIENKKCQSIAPISVSCYQLSNSPILEIINLNCNALEWVSDTVGNGYGVVKGGGTFDLNYQKRLEYFEKVKRTEQKSNIGFRCAKSK